MIVRLMGEAQYRIDDGLRADLNRIDDEAGRAVESGDEQALHQHLEQLAQTVRDRGTRLEDDDLHPSDLIVPPTDLSLDEARDLFSGEGLIPDLPIAG